MSQKPKADAVGGTILNKSSPHRLAYGLAPFSRRLPLKGGVISNR